MTQRDSKSARRGLCQVAVVLNVSSHPEEACPMMTDDPGLHVQGSLAGVVLVAVLLGLWGAATRGALPSGSTPRR